MISSQSAPNARILAISSTKRTPALTKNEIRWTTSPIRSAGTWPESRTVSSTATAVASAKPTSCTGVAPASWRWYEQMLTGFHRGISRSVYATTSAVSRSDGGRREEYVPRDRYSLMMSFCVVPAQRRSSAPPSAAVP